MNKLLRFLPLSVAILTVPALAQEEIVIREPPIYPIKAIEYSVTLICGDDLYRLGMSQKSGQKPQISYLLRNGISAADEEFGKFDRYIDNSGSVNLTKVRCYGEGAISVGISGSYTNPPAGTDDDYYASIEVNF